MFGRQGALSGRSRIRDKPYWELCSQAILLVTGDWTVTLTSQAALAMEETYFWSTLVLGISFLLLLILFLYKMFISPRQVIVSLEKASSGILVADTVPADTALQPSGKTGPSANSQAAAGVRHNWGRHLTLSLAVLSSVLGFILGWDFENNVYAQQWVAQNLAEVGLIGFAVLMGVILLPLAMILLMGFMGREKKCAARHYSSNHSKKK